MNRVISNGLVTLLLSLLWGCGSAPPQQYPNTYERNFSVNLNLADKGGLFTTVSAHVGVNDMANDCTSQYQGFVTLSPGINKLGLAPGKTTFLMVEISHRRHGRSSDFGRGTLITPAAGKQYEVVVNFEDNMFDLRLYETSKSGKKELPLIPASACKPSKSA